MLVRATAIAISTTLFVYSFYYIIVKLQPSTASLEYWSENDWNS
jgi:hypothetical protein